MIGLISEARRIESVLGELISAKWRGMQVPRKLKKSL